MSDKLVTNRSTEEEFIPHPGGRPQIVPNWRIISLILGGIVLLMATYVLWGFWVDFVILTAVYATVASGLIYLSERYYHADFGEFFRDNNTWFYVLVGMTIVTFVIACFNFGPAVLLPENYPTPEQRGTAWDIFQHILYGKNAGPKVIPTYPLPWANGTWFCWKATGIYALVTFGYFWFAFWDEASHAIHALISLIQERRQGPIKGKDKDGKVIDVPPPAGGHDFWKLLTTEFIAEAVVTFIQTLIARRRQS